MNITKSYKEICSKEQCTGCMACASVCKHHAITMVFDKEGFHIPVIDSSLCVGCGLCTKTCPSINAVDLIEPKDVYSGWSNDDTIRMESSSGGAFTEIARSIIKHNGVVFGVRMDENFRAIHDYTETLDGLILFRGSKYTQSDIRDSYIKAKSFLKAGKWVLFSGTPCQIAGLKKFLHKIYEKLVTVELICHGIPSPLIWDNYLNYQKQNLGIQNFTDVKFRSKKTSWFFFCMALKGHAEKTRSVEYYGEYNEDPFIRGFLRDFYLRPSCYQCPYSTKKRCADFTIADWWFYQPDKDESWDFEKKGVSLIFCNTSLSRQIFDEDLSKRMTCKKRSFEEAACINLNLKRATPKPLNREIFWKDYNLLTFDELIKKYMYPQSYTPSAWILTHFVGSDSSIIRFALRVTYKLEKNWNKIKQ